MTILSISQGQKFTTVKIRREQGVDARSLGRARIRDGREEFVDLRGTAQSAQRSPILPQSVGFLRRSDVHRLFRLFNAR